MWSTERPTKQGIYLCYDRDKHNCISVLEIVSRVGELVVRYFGNEFDDPLTDGDFDNCLWEEVEIPSDEHMEKVLCALLDPHYPYPKRPTLDEIIEGLHRVRPKDRMEVLRKLGFRRTTNADYYPKKGETS